LQQITSIVKYAPASFTMISGDDALALPTMAVGGKGLISVIANALPKPVSSLIHLALKGDFTGAAKIHSDISDLLRLIFKDGSPGGVKALMNYQGIVENELRLPLYKVSEKIRSEIIEAYQKI
jgi:4-hydroxy-tetrahydrodipicolinate synthase